MDSCCTSHMTFDRSAYSTSEVIGQSIEMGTGAKAIVASIGDIVINFFFNSAVSSIKLSNVLHLLSFERQLLSVAQMDRRGFLVELENSRCIIKYRNKAVATGTLVRSR